MTRQTLRRQALKAAKKAAAHALHQRSLDALATLRATRSPASLPKQHPGKLIPTGRTYKKPRAEANWRVHDLAVMRDGKPVPTGCEASFHTTKGARCVRVAA
ncbi:hypothetical protein [Brevundimonas sp. GW460-12-10-14-LB2]|uniref:hypothetical protein n=1 Tax=Brevundimonas sp. GW460-12-10-14-LB2 TaxID=1827469 RepID=UPI000A65FAEA|nr:hypothetical protein [Brevundimonas sp. GW460-12-10-14-LB2]